MCAQATEVFFVTSGVLCSRLCVAQLLMKEGSNLRSRRELNSHALRISYCSENKGSNSPLTQKQIRASSMDHSQIYMNVIQKVCCQDLHLLVHISLFLSYRCKSGVLKEREKGNESSKLFYLEITRDIH